jgi:signal transduction histidine kinase
MQSSLGPPPALRVENFDRRERLEERDRVSATIGVMDPSAPMRAAFLRRVAHDIASPTGVTMTALEELAQGHPRPDLAAMARRGLRRLLRLSEQLALVADLEAGSVMPETALEDMRTIVKLAVDAAIAIDGRRDITVESILSDTRLVADVDRRLITSVLREIVGNALRLASSRVVVELGNDGENATLRVSDDGPGFSSDTLATVGERFTARSCARGLGLSLSMARDVLGAHGGELKIETSTLPPGRRGVHGAAVVVTLPLL